MYHWDKCSANFSVSDLIHIDRMNTVKAIGFGLCKQFIYWNGTQDK